MALTAGTRLGPYEIVAAIGRGGMGEVFEARDTRLHRREAIKILPGSLAHEPDRRERFEREARAIAALSHPNICMLHDVGHQNGIDFLVMEYLDGETLSARLVRQPLRNARSPSSTDARSSSERVGTERPFVRAPLPIDETLRIATQLADAVAAAHRAGIVHRDLKPGNVMQTKTGVKVLDFGLAKALTAPGGRVGESAAQAVTTSSDPLTGRGTILGTLPYMAPEQVEGREADPRSDIFAFGALVYEMATGRRAFTGDSQASLIAAILERNPSPISDEHPLTPPALERLVLKCLAKDPDSRWQSAVDLADEQRWQSSSLGAISLTTTRRMTTQSRRGRLLWAAGAVILVAAGGTAFWYQGRNSSAPRLVEAAHRQVTFDGDVLNAALSPDGKTVAYVTGLDEQAVQLFVRDVRGSPPLELWRGHSVWDLKWLADGSHLLISSRQSGQLRSWLVPRLGGAPRGLDVGGGFVAISPTGTHIAVVPGQGSQSFSVVPISGGEPRTITLPGIRIVHGVDWSVSTDRLVIPTVTTDGESVVWTVRPDGQELRRVYSEKGAVYTACWSPGGNALYIFAGQKLVRLPLTEAVAAPETLVSGLPPSLRHCTVSADGQQLLHVRQSTYANLWRLDLSPPTPRVTPLTSGTSSYASPSLSPDRQWVVVSRSPGGDILKIPLGGGEPIPLGKGISPVLSPDGRRLAFVFKRGSASGVWVSDGDGRGRAEVVDAAVTNPLVTWLPDGRLAWQTPDARNYRIRDLATGGEELLMKEPAVGWVFTPRFSPKGDQVALSWNREGAHGLWLFSWPAREGRLVASNMVDPVGWSPDGQWIYAHKNGSAAIFRVSVRNGNVDAVGTLPIGSLGMDSCSLSPDAHTLVCSANEAKADAWLIENFDPNVRTATSGRAR